MSRRGAMYVPSPLVGTFRSELVLMLVTVTVAPATAAPFGSVTVPTRVALFVCASDGRARAASKNTSVLTNNGTRCFVMMASSESAFGADARVSTSARERLERLSNKGTTESHSEREL